SGGRKTRSQIRIRSHGKNRVRAGWKTRNRSAVRNGAGHENGGSDPGGIRVNAKKRNRIRVGLEERNRNRVWSRGKTRNRSRVWVGTGEWEKNRSRVAGSGIRVWTRRRKNRNRNRAATVTRNRVWVGTEIRSGGKTRITDIRVRERRKGPIRNRNRVRNRGKNRNRGTNRIRVAAVGIRVRGETWNRIRIGRIRVRFWVSTGGKTRIRIDGKSRNRVRVDGKTRIRIPLTGIRVRLNGKTRHRIVQPRIWIRGRIKTRSRILGPIRPFGPIFTAQNHRTTRFRSHLVPFGPPPNYRDPRAGSFGDPPPFIPAPIGRGAAAHGVPAPSAPPIPKAGAAPSGLD
ncbi:uncharacterized protein LOC116652629, partial [Coturnix japonica]|uniref:uncharacterized protein LOC116652629 n=1 Tax=Coturnix japonica TaxID=93934 RepID=UPI0013A5D58D